jgi:CCR4-NOT transcription complex subunit 7/8
LIASGRYIFIIEAYRILGLVLNDEVKWISFHGGFDFAYLIKMLNGTILPDEDTGFYGLMGAYFPSFYDIKCMIRDIDTLKNSGLSKIAADINVTKNKVCIANKV